MQLAMEQGRGEGKAEVAHEGVHHVLWYRGGAG
jgi:hypothetical protein